MKVIFILLIIMLPKVSPTGKTIIGHWQLVEISGERGISESDKIMNEGIRKGLYKGYLKFNKDSSFETAFIQNPSPATSSRGKYQVKGNILTTRVNGKETKCQILRFTQDSLKLKMSATQIHLFTRVKI